MLVWPTLPTRTSLSHVFKGSAVGAQAEQGAMEEREDEEEKEEADSSASKSGTSFGVGDGGGHRQQMGSRTSAKQVLGKVNTPLL
ncbi:unnamed protein product [Merluccius merluccius]